MHNHQSMVSTWLTCNTYKNILACCIPSQKLLGMFGVWTLVNRSDIAFFLRHRFGTYRISDKLETNFVD